MTTNEIAAGVQAGQADYLQLWEAVRGFVYDRAYRWARYDVTIDDLQQCAFLALVEAVGSWDRDRGTFLTLYGLKLQAAFTEAAGLRTERDKRDPLRTAVSLDAPLTDDEGDSLTLSDVIPDPVAVAAINNVAEMDFQQRRHSALEKALARLPEAQRAAVVGKCCYGRRVDTRAYNAGLRALRHPSISRELRQYA
ncbi:sigma factor [uncultured Dysosmobacter sp.]|uniref:sigma factor n=1 Tax=uncultured Dysosmobacter sp. TaxID=2591384 RepID=UPI00263722E3|nr:sigma factor [uncultured Dysosmobacter sp.]